MTCEFLITQEVENLLVAEPDKRKFILSPDLKLKTIIKTYNEKTL